VVTEGSEHEALDAAVLNKLRALQREGAPDILRTLILLFLDNAKTMRGNLEDAANAGDRDGLHRASHALTSAAGNIGAKVLAARCKELARQAREGSINNLSPQVAAIVAELQRVEAALVLHLVKPADASERVSSHSE
jgi:HPt (histidine-containing phosphotransfer) domain-containing protein